MGDDMLGELSRGKFSRGNRRVVSGSVGNVESQVQSRVKEIRFMVEPVTDRVKVERAQLSQEWVTRVE
jgi:hypothetical protein